MSRSENTKLGGRCSIIFDGLPHCQYPPLAPPYRCAAALPACFIGPIMGSLTAATPRGIVLHQTQARSRQLTDSGLQQSAPILPSSLSRGVRAAVPARHSARSLPDALSTLQSSFTGQPLRVVACTGQTNPPAQARSSPIRAVAATVEEVEVSQATGQGATQQRICGAEDQ